MTLTVNRCERAGAVDPAVKRSCWQRHFLHSGSLHSCTRINMLLMFIAHLPSNTGGGQHEDRGTLETAISSGNRNMMGHFIYPIKISFTEILLNK